MGQDHLADSRLWLRDELYAESLKLADATPGRRQRVRSVDFSELEALALMLLSYDIEATSGSDRYTQDIAHHLIGVLLARLETTLSE